MKLHEILNERSLGGERKDEHKWNSDLAFERQVRNVRDFLRKYPDKTVIAIYQQAVQDRRFSPEDIRTIREIMDEYNY